jgi:transcriptional regulator with XRE-family HTH domain
MKWEKTDIAALLRDSRKKADLGMRELSRLSGVPVSTISKLESGALDNPSFVTMIRLSNALNLDPMAWFDKPAKRRTAK